MCLDVDSVARRWSDHFWPLICKEDFLDGHDWVIQSKGKENKAEIEKPGAAEAKIQEGQFATYGMAASAGWVGGWGVFVFSLCESQPGF